MKFLDRNLPQFSQDHLHEIAEAHFGLTGQLKPLSSERDQNHRLRTEDGDYVLKVFNAAEAHQTIDLQTQALLHLEASDCTLATPRILFTKSGQPHSTITDANGNEHIVRVLTYLSGELVANVERTSELSYGIGQKMAQLDHALRGFYHAHARHEMLWDVTQSEKLRPYTTSISSKPVRKIVEKTLSHLHANTLPALKSARHQVIHGDAHLFNMLVDPNDPSTLSGILDFGDMIHASLALELAVACDVRGVARDKLVERITMTTLGYDSIIRLEDVDVDVLYDLIMARLAVTATIIGKRNAPDSNQPAFNADLESQIWQTVTDLDALGAQHVRGALRDACRFPTQSNHSQRSRLIEKRQAKLGKHLAHFYREPVYLERGSGVWLYAPDGTAYLDGYNNIPIAGHCHPHVINAVTRQISTLNTHTRYLYDVIVRYAERLTATLPPHLTVCSFVNSGSEANDIAWRMAQHVTGNRGALVIEGAYHGITNAIYPMSPSRRTDGFPSHVKYLLEPNPYRGKFRAGEAELAHRYAADADRAIAELAAQGMKPAAFMVDTLFTSNGSPDVPEGYVTAVTEKVRAAGGLLIADEVQAGFGRSGIEMWGHQLHGVTADIVTMGKPVGNGYPLGVIVTTPDILNAFVGTAGLFSTFGGNPVACAAGLAVLDIMDREGLQENARLTGDYLCAGIRKLMNHHAIIGDVRGHGLMVAVELVLDPDNKTPAVAEAKRLINLMRDERVLISTGGRLQNVLKIRPPLQFKPKHADIMLAALDKCLGML